jgi:translation initiation factor IF-2
MQAAQAAQIALEAGRDADKKLAEQDAKRQEMIQKQKQEAEDLKHQQIQSKQKENNIEKVTPRSFY